MLISGYITMKWEIMSVVVVDDKGRITLPKRLREGVRKVVLIPAGSHIVLIPLRGEPREIAEGWLRTGKGRGKLKEVAEGRARMDALERAGRRNDRRD